MKILRNTEFNYQQAFQRNLGWITPEEQALLASKVIALPGLGGVGCHHLNNFLRLGVQKFHLADFDSFALSNFNRQLGANCETLGRSKLDSMWDFALKINPNCELKLFSDGVTDSNQDEFLSGVDLIVDTLDIYAMDIRRSLYQNAHDKKIPMVTAGPFGMGTTVMAFHPEKMSFVEYFNIASSDLSLEEMVIRFLAGIVPPMVLGKKSYLVYPEGLNIRKRVLPSLNIGCEAATAALGTAVLKILLNRPSVRWAPAGFYMDFYQDVSRL
jgi:molybdopterin/thiamine biosynthesis adenylyltransferase